MNSNQISSPSAITVTMAASDVALMTMDWQGSNANILNRQLFAELDQIMAELAQRSDLAGVILASAKPSIFVAGADLNQIVANLDWPDEEIVKFCEQGRAVMARFSRCPFVSVAAIHGACVGGGLELALWCDCRIATDHRRTVLGLPEVKLGLVPGWAGTARLPRISGFEVAAELVTSGRLVSSQEGLRMKFIDQVVPQGELISKAIEMVRRVRTSEAFIRDRKTIMGPVPGLELETANETLAPVVQRLGSAIVDNQEIFPYAPTVVLEHMARTAPLGIRDAWNSESLAMAQVWGSPASRGLLNHFFLNDHNRKSPGLVDLTLSTPAIETIGIVGAGLMGRAIAAQCLAAGIQVVLLDANPAAAQAAADELGDHHPTRLIVAENHDAFRNVPLVLESVVETVDVKTLVLQQIERATSPQTIIASNTSAIPIERLAKTIQHPQRLCGIHFCHPKLMALVEVVSGPQSSESTITAAVRFVQQLRKMPIAINDSPGFVVNRLLAAMIDQSVRWVDQGTPIAEVDLAIREFGFLAGPFEMIDVIGVDTCMYAGRTMWEAGMQCVSLSPALPRLMKAGALGRKTGQGFYRYANPESDPEWNAEILNTLRPTTRPADNQPPVDRSQLAQQIMAAVALEATRILDEAVVADHRDLDLCIIHGIAFPKHRGGILFWADQVGWQAIKETLYQIGKQDARWDPSETVIRMANQSLTYYKIPEDSTD